jgi:peptidoglycan/LPS O-acetylase OafA/YrhL
MIKYLRIYDGARFLSTCYVLWGHTLFDIQFFSSSRNNYVFIPYTIKTYACAIFDSAVMAVDFFFFLGGYFVYYNLKKHSKNLRKKNFLGKIKFFIYAIIQRYIRLLPLNLICIFFISYTFPFLASGAKSDLISSTYEGCRNYWWANLLYIQNLIEYNISNTRCAPHTWYLGCDFFYFILIIFILIFFVDKKNLRNLILKCLFISCIIWEFSECLDNDYTSEYAARQGGEKNGKNFFYDFYCSLKARIAPYIMGIFYCKLFFKTDLYKENKIKNKENTLNNQINKKSLLKRINIYIKNSKYFYIFLFLISYIQINYGLLMWNVAQNYKMPKIYHAFAITFHKLFLVNGTAGILHLLLLGKFNFLMEILSSEIFSILSKFSFGIYLFHYFIAKLYIINTQNDFMFEFINASFISIGVLIMSTCFTFAVSLIFEIPLINILRKKK